MIRNRFAVLVFGATLALGSVAGFVGTAAADEGTPPTTITPAVPSGPVSLTIPGVGLVSFDLDPSGAITNIVIAPEAGLTAGAPTLTTEGFKVDLTAADGTVRVLEVSVETKDGRLQIETGVEVGDSGDNNNGGQSTDDHGLHNGRTTDPQPAHGNDTGRGHQGGGNDNAGGGEGSTSLSPAPAVDTSPNHGGSSSDHGGDHGNNGGGGNGGGD